MAWMGSLMNISRIHFNHLSRKGSLNPSDSLMFSLTSAGRVRGSCEVGSPGARSRMAKMIRLMTINVGMAKRVRRRMYWAMAYKVTEQKAKEPFR